MDCKENFLTTLNKLKEFSIIVADTGDINLIKEIKPTDATTNPSLLVKAAEQNEYSYLVQDAIDYGCKKLNTKDPNNKELVDLILDRLYVNFGKEILKHIEGYVSTEIDARLSFDTEESVKKGRRIIELYAEEGIPRDRILIKIAATWEGIRAAEILEKEGIHCNLTLILSFIQAVASAQAGIFLISPFVGRVNDGFSLKYNKSYLPHEEPGIFLVKEIYHYFKKYDYNTIIMAASVRTPESVLELAGCDRITIPPGVLQKLAKMDVGVEQRLDVESSKKIENFTKLDHVDEKTFRWSLNQDEIGNEKLADGIRIFARDAVKLESVIKAKLNSA